MFYQNLKFPKIEQSSRASRTKKRPFFYTNFVSTIDGKVAVKKPGYWPIGSKLDYEILLELRAYADCLIHGKNLYHEFGSITKSSLNKQDFKDLRKKLGKDPELPFIVGSRDLKKLSKDLYEKGYRNILIEGGPTLLGSFLKMNLIDEIFLTIAPKIYGTEKESTGGGSATKNLVEGQLFPPDQIKHLKLISVKKIKDELFLRYSLKD